MVQGPPTWACNIPRGGSEQRTWPPWKPLNPRVAVGSRRGVLGKWHLLPGADVLELVDHLLATWGFSGTCICRVPGPTSWPKMISPRLEPSVVGRSMTKVALASVIYILAQGDVCGDRLPVLTSKKLQTMQTNSNHKLFSTSNGAEFWLYLLH